MADGTTRPIDEVNVGDSVVTTNPATGESSARQVTMLHANRDRDLVDVTVSDRPADAADKSVGEGKGDRSTRGPTESVLHTTSHHPFWDATTGEWVDAGDLVPGTSTLVGPNGQLQHVTKIHKFTGAKVMRDLTVAEIHTYYVLVGSGPVLVHNCDVGGSGGANAVDNSCEHVCLGVNPHSDDLAGRLDAHTFNGTEWGTSATLSGRPLWMDGVSSAAKSGNTKISFTLDGLFGVGGKSAARTPEEAFSVNYARGIPMAGNWLLGAQSGNGTAWELATVGRAVRLGNREWGSIDWYWQGKKVDLANPFE